MSAKSDCSTSLRICSGEKAISEYRRQLLLLIFLMLCEQVDEAKSHVQIIFVNDTKYCKKL